jgi:exopolysaccharide biosynthesis polyprenyl glycosylphosphotransferase
METLTYNREFQPGSQESDLQAERTSRAGNRSLVLRYVLLAADLFSAALAAVLVTLIFGLPIGEALILMGTLTVSSVFLAFVFGLYRDADLTTWASGLSDAPRALVAALVIPWPVIAVAYLVDMRDPELVAAVATVTTAGIDSIARAAGRGWVHRVAPLRQRAVIVGSGLVADRLADRLQRHTEFGIDPIGLVDDDVHTPNGSQLLPTLGGLNDLTRVLENREIDRVLIAFSRASHEDLLNCIRTCRDQRIAVDVVPRLFELLDSGQAINQIGGMPLLSIGAPPLAPASRVAKRGLDIVLSALILLLLSPLLLLIALAIKLSSRGPVFFRQRRAGRGDNSFVLLKFRSMYEDAEERKRDYEQENDVDDGVMFKIKSDPRVTRVGRVLRRFSLDELPQLINVLRGDMSMVGPRPLIPSEARHAADNWAGRRLDLRPGITGLWQVSGRSDLPFQEMVRFDYQYVSGWSIARDIEILLATIPVVVSGRGAY